MPQSGRGEGEDRIQLASAVVLPLAALVTAWAAYQASLWDGEQAAHYSRAGALRVEATQQALEDSTHLAAEIRFFTQWLNAKSAGDEELAAFYRSRFPPDMTPAFNAWLAERPFSNPTAPRTPFDMAAYQRSGRAASAELHRKAEGALEAGQRANDTSDAFTEGTTILAMSLFFGGIVQVFSRRTPRITLLAIATLTLLLGAARITGLPALAPGFGS